MAKVEIKENCERRGIKTIFHYTVLESLPSIVSHRGILCRTERRNCGLVCQEHGWGPYGREEDLEDYVSCSLEPPYGMIRAEEEPLILCEIDSKLIWDDDTLFCPAWSSYHKFDLDYLKEHATVEDFDNMFLNPFSSGPRYFGAEILVKNRVQLGDILKVYFTDRERLNEALQSCTEVIERKGRIGVTIAFITRPEVFKRPPGHYLKHEKYRPNDV